MARPFVKWVGGKRQLLSVLLEHMPADRHGLYVEPFIGGGALYWHVAGIPNTFQRFWINDANRDLIEAYRAVRDHPQELLRELVVAEDRYKHTPKDTFHWWRDFDPDTLSPIARAVRFFVLMRAGFNGVWRTNLAGKFNVPWGKKDAVTLADPEVLRQCSEVLEQTWTRITRLDYSAVLEHPFGPDDFIYLDPPYIPLTKTADFTGYTAKGFSEQDQVNLAEHFRRLATQEDGPALMLSNSDTPLTRRLYDGFTMIQVQAKRNVAAASTSREAVGELVILSTPVTSTEDLVSEAAPAL